MKKIIVVACLLGLASTQARAADPATPPSAPPLDPAMASRTDLKSDQIFKLLTQLGPKSPDLVYVPAYYHNRKGAHPDDIMTADFPTLARIAQVKAGGGRIACQFDDAGNLSNCQILAEVPTGYGFGAATIDFATQAFQVDRVKTQGVPMHDWIVLNVNWNGSY